MLATQQHLMENLLYSPPTIKHQSWLLNYLPRMHLGEEKNDYSLLFFSVRWSKWSQSNVVYHTYSGVKVMIIKESVVADI